MIGVRLTSLLLSCSLIAGYTSRHSEASVAKEESSRHSEPVEESREILEDILYLTGAAGEEDLDEEIFQHFSNLSMHPIAINTASLFRLHASGLFTDFQLASLRDYISRHGYVLSERELAGVSGFSAELTSHLLPFVSFDIPSNISPPKKGCHEIGFRIGDKVSLEKGKGIDNKYLWSVKYKVGWGERSGLYVALDKAYSGGAIRDWKKFRPWIPAVHLSGDWISRNGRWRLVFGDFKVRFGQGLVVYNGFTTSSIYTLSGLDRRSSGVTPANSFSASSSVSGIAGEFAYGSWEATIWCDTPRSSWNSSNKPTSVSGEISAGAHVGYRFRDFYLGTTGVCSFRGGKTNSGKAGIDFSGTFGSHWYIFGEGIYNFFVEKFEGVVGVKYTGFESVKLGARGLFQYGNIQGNIVVENRLGRAWRLNLAAFGGVKTKSYYARGNAELVWDGAGSRGGIAHGLWSNTTRVNYQWNKERGTKESTASPVVKHRLTFKNETRYNSSGSGLTGNFSLSATTCDKFGIMPSGTVGYCLETWRVFFQAAYWYAPSWNDRLYLYLRDIPESFTIPALYKEGILGNIYASVKIAKPRPKRRSPALALHARLGAIYLFNTRLTAELKFACNIKF